MPTLPNEQQQSQYFMAQRPPHSRSQSYQIAQGPQISPLSTSDQSSQHNASTPASPTAYSAHQNRPLYMPAALRPNEFPSRSATKPKASSADNSDTESDSTLRRSNTNLRNVTSFGLFGKTPSRPGTSDQAVEFGDHWDMDIFPEITSAPTREHWKVR